MSEKIKISQTKNFIDEALLSSVPVGFIITDAEWNICWLNDNISEFGLITYDEKDKFIGRAFKSIPFIAEDKKEKIIKNISAGYFIEEELSIKNSPLGDELILLLKAAPVERENKFDGAVFILEDIKLSSSLKEKASQSSENLIKLLGLISDYYLIAQKDGDIVSSKTGASEDHQKIFGNYKTNIKVLNQLTNSDTIQQLFYRSVKNNSKENTTLSITFQKNEYFFYLSILPLESETGAVENVLLLFDDISSEVEDKIRLENELSELRRYQKITRSILDAVINVNTQGKIIFWNEAAQKLFGYSKSEVFERHIENIIPEFSGENFNRIVNEIEKTGGWESEINFTSDKGEEYLRIKMGFVVNGNGKTIVMLCSNITERAKNEAALRHSEERFRSIVLNTLEYICNLNLNGNITYVNPHFVKVFGYSEEEFLKLNIRDLIDPSYLSQNDFEIVLSEGINIVSKEIPLITKNGNKVYVLANFTSVVDLNGTVLYYNAIFTDITEKKHAEKDLLLIRSIFDASQDGVAVTYDRKIILANKRTAEIFGFDSVSDIYGKNILDFIIDEDKKEFTEFVNSLSNETKETPRIEFRAFRKDGTQIIIENSISKYEFEGDWYYVSVMRDISAQKQTQRELKQSEERLRSITENIDEFMWTAENIEGSLRQVFYTAAVEKITGYTSEEFVENNHLWHRIIHPNDQNYVIKRMKRFYRDPASNSTEIEYRIQNREGNIIWIKNRINLIRNNKGVIEKIYGSVRDISLSKRAEEKLQESANNLKALNETKDRFISIVSHDLRTPFSSILGFTDILLSDPKMEESKRMEYINFIQESSKNMLSLVNSLLDWTRLQTGRIHFEPERINATYVVSKVVQMLSGASLRKSINLTSLLDKDVYVHADENLLLQVLSNLISNAIKFTQTNGIIEISAEPIVDKKQIKFCVRDNGKGIDEEDLEKLFRVDTKFSTTGTMGETGTGLGLSLCKEIVEKHGGEIWAESQINEGSAFYFTIPFSSTQILLVDDHKADRLLYNKLLKSVVPNYTIVEAENGEEAFKIIKQSSPALVITDHNMPVMSGLDLVKKVTFSELKYVPPIMVLSGDINPEIGESYRELGVEFVFTKPVDLNKFKFAVDKSLRSSVVQ
ncbi:MAG: PAS domain S-box protein [Melioribacteraceae bacterium]|nr:PAS domain S-box protein [Melioribacteraceae bacterium]